MICPKCGNKVKDNACFCGNCGTKLSQKDVAEEVTKEIKYSVKVIATGVIIVIGISIISGLINKSDKISGDAVDEEMIGGYESEESHYENNSQFDRLSYISNAISADDFLRYRDKGLCYLEKYMVDNVPEERLYICRNDTGSSWIVIDDSSCTLNSNALPGDMVTVYGRYNDIVELTFADGSRNNQVPMVYADKLVDNSLLPEDKDEFIDQVVQYMNSSDLMYGSGSEYCGDYNAKIAIGVYYSWVKELKHMSPSYWASLTKEQYFGGWYVCHIDGYGVSLEFESNENIVEPYQNGVITDEDIDFYSETSDGNIPVYAWGRITKMELLSPSVIRLTFCIDSFEAYY